VVCSSVTLQRQGLWNRTSIDKVWLERDGVIITSDKKVSSDDTVMFALSDLTIAKGGTETLTVAVSLDAAGTTQEHNFSVIDLDCNTDTVSGLPVAGETLTTMDYTVAGLTFYAKGGDTTIDVGDNDVTIAEFKLEEATTSKKNVVLESVMLKNTGSAKNADLSNITLYDDNENVTADVVIDGDYVTIVLVDGYVIEDGKSKIFTLKADIDAGETGDTYKFKLKENFHINSSEEGTNMGATIAGGGTDLKIYTVNAGKVTLSLDTSTPASEDYVKETDDVLVMVAKVDTDQKVLLDNIRVYIHADTTDIAETTFESRFENFKLYVDGTLVDSIDDVTSNDGTIGNDGLDYIEFSSVEVNDDDLIEVYVDLTSTANAGDVLKLSMNNVGTSDGNSNSFKDVEYISDGETVKQAKLGGTATSNLLTVVDSSDGVTITRNDGWDATTVFLAWEKKAMMMQFVINAGNSSDVKVKKLNFDLDATNSSYINYTNAMIYIDDVQVGSVEDFAQVGVEDWTLTIDNLDYIIPKNGQAVVKFVVDVDTSTTAEATTDIYLTLDVSDSLFYDVNSNEIAIAAWDVDSAPFVMSENAQLTIALDGNTADEAILVANSDDVSVASYKFSSADGDVLVKEIRLKNINANADSARISSYDLYVDGVYVSSRVPSDTEIDFNLGSENGFVITKDESVVVEVKANLNTITDASQTNGIIELELTDLKADTKVTSKALTQVENAGWTVIDNGNHYTTSAVAGLNIQSNVMYIRKTVPTFASVDLGTTKLLNWEQTLYKVKVTADSAEDVEFPQMSFTIGTNLANANLSTFKLYVNGTEDTNVTCVETTANALVTCTANTAADDIVVSAGTMKEFEVKATTANVVDNDYVTIKVSEDADSLSAGAENRADALLDNDDLLIWTDNSGSPHSDTTVDFFNGFKVPGLDTDSTTLEN